MTLNPLTLPHKFRPREYQIPFLRALDSGVKNAVVCWCRGAGKDLCAMNYLIKKAMQQKGVYLHCFPNYNQAKRAIWKSVHETETGESVSYLDHIPAELIKSKNSSEMTIELINGSIYCILGVDGKNAQRARGMNPSFVIMSEYAFMDEDAWRTIEPRVVQNNGTAIFISTPNGQNHFYTLYNHAKANPERYFTSMVTIDKMPNYDPAQIEAIRARGDPEDFIQQEYFCSFTRGAEGSYYGKLIQKARDTNRICPLPIDPNLPVHTAWDLGFGDHSAIWFFQVRPEGFYHFINYYENHGEGMRHYVDVLKQFKETYDIQWGTHFCPHDIGNHEFVTGVERLQSLREFGIEAIKLPQTKVPEGIQAVRSILPNCFFDEIRCARGVKCLDFYRKKYNDVLKTYYDTPLHDQWSHGADAFRYAAIGIKSIGFGGGTLQEDIKAIQNYFGN